MSAEDELRAQVAAQRVSCIVGTGVSISATYNPALRPNPASWSGLLELGVAECVTKKPELVGPWEQRVLADARSSRLNDLVISAERITLELEGPRGSAFSRWLERSVGRLAVTDESLPKALGALGVRLLTTNYDGVLEKVLSLPPLDWTERSRVARFIRRDSTGVLHLHGYWENPDSIVLGLGSYMRVLADEHAQAVQQALGLAERLLFVGCRDGLLDPNFGELLKWSGRLQATHPYPHYVLVRESEVAGLRRELPPTIEVISYGRDYGELAPFLRRLVPQPRVVRVPVAAPRPTISRVHPVLGPVGQWVYVHGTNFVIGQTFVSACGSAKVPAHVYDQGQLGFTLPPDAAGTGKITIEVPGGSTDSAQDYEVGVPMATPDALTIRPSTASPGAWIYVNGANFVYGRTTVDVAGIPGISAVVYGPDELGFAVPTGANKGSGPIKVKTPNGASTTPGQLTIL